ncbi:glycosyltransferase family 2 protein [Sediminibacterium ginsengisoli]|uniref:Glycosyltransferase, catalytic subunit of cellulose synthase and poly-beta-1,6-N-acetylglucosamine synthase n=1 Tax=Sediminibacterium ginsengisoli TaxID=413434 RepID=A0A1T4RM55_9BACT|nr:glycosyltransferase family 2 protein [Sediminibacterium ginsengisoli]SKA17023.1 Glycosyltransferase, catalytic subunit of cellulose synthase and poly-beta-1,6-N-acetylglucosamine synthase [Sediminibacterium ginsengisoli]
MIFLFWISLFIIFYTYAGYGILLYLILKLTGRKRRVPAADYTPTLTLIVAAYNEEKIIREKIENTLALIYPAESIRYIFVTDGSSDNTAAIIAEYPQIQLMHRDERAGKIAAVHRVMKQVTTEIVVFTDANTFLNKEALIKIARHYQDQSVGAVSGEKRVHIEESADATAGEGFYWKYESKLKQWDSELYSVVGAAGELFSIRTALYQPVPLNALLDDFMISLRIVEKGYRIVYEPEAFATETSSANVEEELKRKVRIAAGGIQSVIWLKSLMNPFKYPLLSFQYISHRVLRWTITPLLMILVFFLNMALVLRQEGMIYDMLMAAQGFFYAFALLGWFLEKKSVRVKILFIPYYFCMMNYAVLAGILRYFTTEQTGVWEKAERK